MMIDKNIYSVKDPKQELMTFDDNCIDLLVTAPPVFTMTGKEDEISGTSYSWDTFDDYIDYMGTVFTEVYRVLKNQHYCIINVGDVTTLIGERQWAKKSFPLAAYFIRLLEWIGFTYVSEYTIDKGRKALSGTGRGDCYPFEVNPVSSTEHVLIFIKKGDINTPVPCPRCGNKDTSPYGYTLKGDRNWICNKCSTNVYFERGVIMSERRKEKNIIPPDVIDRWSSGVVQINPAIKDGGKKRYLPGEVAEMAMLFYSGVGDVVLDPFSGVGATIMTALKYKRRFVCFERDEHDRKRYLSCLLAIKKRIEKANAEVGCKAE